MTANEASTQPGTGYLVAQVIPTYPPCLGGMERVAQHVAEFLAHRHRVEVITTTCDSGGAPLQELRNGVLVQRYRARRFAHTPLSPGLLLRLLTLPRTAIVHAHVAHAFLPEVVWLASRLRRRSFILHFHLDVDASGRLGVLLPAYKRLVLGPVLRRATTVIALSEAQARFLKERYGVAENRVTVIPNGVDPSFAATATSLPMADGEGKSLRLLFVGRLDAQKNVTRLVAALEHVRVPVELTIVGDGAQKTLIEEQVSSSGMSNVRLVGASTGEKLREWYAWADVFVLPSDKEGMPLVVLEAMASGLPVVATDVPGSRELVAGVGLLAAPRPDALGAAIEQVAADPALRAELSARSARCAAGHSWHERIADVERLYDHVALAG